MSIKRFLTTIAILLFCFSRPTQILAGQYGEIETSPEISIDKKVKHPDQTTKGGEPVWVDNLFVSDYKFTAGQEIEFKITVTNTSNNDLDNVHFKDILPQYLEYVSGNIDAIFSLKAGESKDFYFKSKVVDSIELPDNYTWYCVVNTAQAWNGKMVQDTAQVCVEKQQVLGVKTIPEAGPAENLAILLSSGILGCAGWALAKKRA